MRKSAITWCLDIVRYLLIISGTAAIVFFLGTRVHWLLSIISAAPVYVAILFLCDFLMLPLYLMIPEHRVVVKVLKAIEQDDFDMALRILEMYEKVNAGRPGGIQSVKPTNVNVEHAENMGAQSDDLIQNGIQKLQLRCGELIDSIGATNTQESSCPDDEGRLLNHNKFTSQAEKEKLGACKKRLPKKKKAARKPKADSGRGSRDKVARYDEKAN